MFAAVKRPFGSPNAVIYSYELSKFFLPRDVTSMLEIGCGIGIFAFRYAFSHPKALIVAVDQSEKTINYLRSHYSKYYENLQLQSCDFCEDGLDLGSTFDAAYTSDVLEHVTDIKHFVENIHRHLRVGGTAVVNFPNEINHGINHFREVADIRALFSLFQDVKVFSVEIQHPVASLWLSARSLYENLFSRSTKEARERLYHEREEQGIDCFEESTCFSFVNENGKIHNFLASLVAETFLLVPPRIHIRQIEDGDILNHPRLVAVAVK